jgi:hypothetical protein
MSPPTDLHPAAADSLPPIPAAVAPLPDRWTVRSTQTASSVHAVDMSRVEVEAPALVLAGSSGSRLDVLKTRCLPRGQLRHHTKCLLPYRLRQKATRPSVTLSSLHAVICNDTVCRDAPKHSTTRKWKSAFTGVIRGWLGYPLMGLHQNATYSASRCCCCTQSKHNLICYLSADQLPKKDRSTVVQSALNTGSRERKD